MTLQEREHTLRALLMRAQEIPREAAAGKRAAAYRWRRRRDQLHGLCLALPDRHGENPAQVAALHLMMQHEAVVIERLLCRIVCACADALPVLRNAS